MKTTTVRELKHETAKVLGWAEAGEVVELTRRGKPIARIGAVPRAGRVKRPDFGARLRAIYGEVVLPTTGTDVVAEGRGER